MLIFHRVAQSFSATPPHLETKYIVFESKLLDLFKKCSSCGSDTISMNKSSKGTLLKVSVDCWACQTSKTWESQPWYHTYPAGNLLLSGAIMFAGGSPAKMLRVLESMRIKSIHERTFYRHQDQFLHPVIERRWRLEQTALLEQLRAEGRGLVIGGDGRADSPGHSAKYGLYTALELVSNKIVNMQLVQVIFCSNYIINVCVSIAIGK